MNKPTNPRFRIILAAALCAGSAAALAQDRAQAGAAPRHASPGEILASAPASDWRELPAEELLALELADGSRVVVQLADRFAPAHVANIRLLAAANWYDENPIARVQDNYVVQWGAVTEDHPLPQGVVPRPPAEYDFAFDSDAFRPLGFRDTYAQKTGYFAGWPAAHADGRAWLTHCYGTVGAGRESPPDTGSGAELYVAISHAPRHLDRNLAVVGRVVFGMEALSALERGLGPGGYYLPLQKGGSIRSVRLASDLPAEQRPRLEMLRTESESFARWVASRATRPEDFWVHPAGAVDICNATPPVRPIAGQAGYFAQPGAPGTNSH